MVVKVSQEQLGLLRQRECNNYINKLYQIIVKNSPALDDGQDLIIRLKEADHFTEKHGFENKQIKAAFLIINAYEPGFYKNQAMQDWLLNGSESVEREFIKYQKIRENLLNRGII